MRKEMNEALGQLSAEDIAQGRLVEQMRQHSGYPILVEFWNAQREAIIANGKQAAKKKDEFNAAGYWMMLDGFDKACSMVDRVAARSEGEQAMDELEKEGRRRAEK